MSEEYRISYSFNDLTNLDGYISSTEYNLLKELEIELKRPEIYKRIHYNSTQSQMVENDNGYFGSRKFVCKDNKLISITLTHFNLKVIPKQIFMFSDLIGLYIERCPIELLDDNIGNLQRLEHFTLSNSNIYSLPEAFFTILHLKRLHISSKHFYSFSESFSNFKQLEILEINGNLTEIPPTIGEIKSLKYIDFSWNNLKSLPNELANLPNLGILLLNGNKFTIFPEIICELYNLEEIQLYHNAITEIPSCISNLKKLNTLNLFDNNIKTIPPELLSLPNLESIALRENPLKNLDEIAKYFLTKNIVVS